MSMRELKRKLKVLFLCRLLRTHDHQYRLRISQDGEEKKIQLGRFCQRDCKGMENLNPRLIGVDIGDGDVDQKWYLPGNDRAEKGWWKKKFGDIGMMHSILMSGFL